MSDGRTVAGTATVEVNQPHLIAGLMVLTFATGLIDAASYLGLGRIFTANMTGNFVFLGFSISGAAGVHPSGQAASICAFAAGALMGGRLGHVAAELAGRRFLILSAFVEAVLLFAAALLSPEFAARLEGYSLRIYAVIILTALAMGWRTAIVRRLNVADMSTTVLTLTLTGLAAESSVAGGDNRRYKRRLASIALMLGGACAGAMLMRWGLAPALAAAGACALGAAAAYARVKTPVFD